MHCELKGVKKLSPFFCMKNLADTSPFPVNLQVSKAKGIYLYTNNGERYTDLISGVGVNNIGHCQKKVINAINKQSKKHLHIMVYGEYLQSIQEDFAKKICGLLPEAFDKVFFTNSGTEAIEAALKLAKRCTGKYEFVALNKSYHGSTQGSLSVTGNEEKKYAYRPFLPGVTFINQNSFDDLKNINQKTAAVILEIIQGDAGVRLSNDAWLQALQKRCKETGTLIIADEIQTGFGRTGKMFAYQHYNFTPDIICIGKAMAGGMHMGALVAPQHLMNQFTHNPILGHISTFGGHPISCAAGIANIELLLKKDWIKTSQSKADKIYATLIKHPKVIAIRYSGLFFAIDLSTADEVTTFLEYLKNNEKSLAFRFLSAPYSFRLAPPLCISNKQIEVELQKLIRALNCLQ